MFCSNCGIKIDENVKFCPQCGTPLQAPIQKPQAPVQEPIVQPVPPVVENIPIEPVVQAAPPVVEAPIVEPVQEIKQEPVQPASQPVVEPVAQPAPQEPIPPVKKKKKKKAGLIIGIISLVLVAALGVFAFLNFDSIKNLFVKMTTSDEGYVQHVYENESGKLAESIGNFISSLSTPVKATNQAAEAEMKIELGDQTIALLEEALNMELDWVKSAAIAYSMNIDGSRYSLDMDLKFNGVKVVSADMVCDMEEQSIYLNVDDITTKPIRISFAEMTDGGYSAFNYEETLEMTNKILSILPDGKVVENLINRYSKVILGCIEEVEKENETLEIGDVSIKCEKYTFTIDEKLVSKVLKAVLKEAKKDDELKDMIKDVLESEGMSELGVFVDADEILDEFENGIDEAIDEISPDMFDEFEFDFSTFVNNAGEIIGMELENDEGAMSFVSFENGKDTALEIKIDVEGTKIIFSGTGKKSGDKLNATYTLKAMNMKIVEISVIDYDTKAAEEGRLSGAIEIKPAKDAISMISSAMYDAPEAISNILTSDVKLRLDFESNDKAANFALSILSNNKSLIKISTSAKAKETTSVKVPSNAVDVEDVDNVEEILSQSGVLAIIEKFVDAGVPRDLVDSFLEGELSNGNHDDEWVGDWGEDWDEDDWDTDYEDSWDTDYEDDWDTDYEDDWDVVYDGGYDMEYPAPAESEVIVNILTPTKKTA